MKRVTLLAAAIAGPSILSGLVGAQAPAGDGLGELLAMRFRFTPAQVAAVRRGQAVAQLLPPTGDREVAVAGAVDVGVPAERLVDVLQDVERLESGDGFLRTKRLSDPPRLEDFDDLTLPAVDVAALRTCRPGHCDVKLGQGAFDLLQQIDWRAPDATARVNALARRTSLEYVEAYRTGGNQELAIYRDSERPQFIAQEFAEMMAGTHLLPDMLPALADFLLRYPAGPRPDNSRDFFYWSLAEFGLKPVVRLNHVVVYSTGQPSGIRYAVAVKQLYASHYFHTALEIRAMIDDAGRAGRASHLVVLNMARSDGFTGLFGGVVKSKVRKRSREGVQKALAAIKRLAEGAGP